jgi:hypothetical protein
MAAYSRLPPPMITTACLSMTQKRPVESVGAVSNA